MEIIIAQNVGFCFGVDRAYNLSLESLKNNEECQMLGNLVHNEKVVEDLKKRGLSFISSVEQAHKTVIIRAHGVGDRTIKELERKGVRIIDATCPLVKKAQDLARILHQEGRTVIIIGEKDHAEVRAINGAIDDTGIVVESEEEINLIAKDKPAGIVIQTTQDAKKIKRILKKAQEDFKDVKICETFCHSVMKRQEEVRSLAQTTDIILVIGSEKSANTQRLVEIARQEKENVYGVKDGESIDKKWFFRGARVGVISGTSAPKWIINEVIEKLNQIKKGL